MSAGLIGRRHQRARLHGQITRTTDSHGGLVLVVGEAGIGKTSLVTWAAAEARRAGALVLSGFCWGSESAPGYWPWVQVLRALQRSTTSEEWAELLRSAGGGIPALLGDRPEVTREGFPLHDAVTSALVSASQRRPVVVVLDDLHWADPASLRLLEFVAQHSATERLLLVGTYRDAEVEAAEHELRAILLRMSSRATTAALTGLAEDEVRSLMERICGAEPDPDLVMEVHYRTGGNPFFVEQTTRLWQSAGPLDAVAPGVRDAVRRRASLLPRPVLTLLEWAAVLGHEFDRDVLVHLVAMPAGNVDRLVQQAATARFLTDRGTGRLSFVHDLVRETIYGDIDDVGHRHAAVLDGVTQAPVLSAHLTPAELAHHATLAGRHIDPGRATDLLVAAARDAIARLATEEAAGHYRRALERARASDGRRHVRAALDLADHLHHVGEPDQAWVALDEAASAARAQNDPILLARTALVVHGAGNRDAGRGPATDLLQAAHDALTGSTAAAGAAADPDRLAAGLIERLAALAEGGDDDALMAGLWARYQATWGLGTAAARVELSREMTMLGRRGHDLELLHFGASLGWVSRLELGDETCLDAYRDFLASAEGGGDVLGSFTASVDQSVFGVFSGAFDVADGHLKRAVDTVDEDQFVEFGHKAAHLQWALRLLRGDLDEPTSLHDTLAAEGHPHPHLPAAVAALELGDVKAAVAHLAEDPGPHPRDHAPFAWRCRAAVAAATGNAEECERVRVELTPHRGQWLVSLYGWDISGPVDYWLALVGAAQGRGSDAISGFIAARDAADRLGARPWSVLARLGLARALAARGRDGDDGRAAAVAEDAAERAAALGMRRCAAQAAGLRDGLPPGPRRTDPPAPLPDPPTPGRVAGEFRRDGATWVLGFAGRRVHVPPAKGLDDLHRLIGRPGADVPVTSLLHPEGGAEVIAAARLGGDPVLDDEAKARYRRRLEQLDEALDRASLHSDDRARADLTAEREALLGHLRSAAGLGGRTRRLGDASERARKTVSARIRDALRRLDEAHPQLAAHLRASVTTGIRCRYDPRERVDWSL